MGIHVKNGTPTHGPSLCESCMYAHIERGFNARPRSMVYCEAIWLPIIASNSACTNAHGYSEMKRYQALKQMEDIAWVLHAREDGKRVTGVRSSEVDISE